MRRTKRLRSLALALLFATSGTTAGMLAGSAAAVEPVTARCEADECNHGFFWDSCEDNPAGFTQCNMVGSRCVTKSCADIPVIPF